MKQPSKIQFANEKVKKAFEELKGCETCEKGLYKHLTRAFRDIEEDSFCGIQFPKRLIPKEYIRKYGIKNKYSQEVSTLSPKLLLCVALPKVAHAQF